MKKIFLLFILVLLVSPVVFAKEGKMYLLAVKEATNEGSAAELFLEVKSGKGRVFIETIPLTKFDTQISTRFAKDIACDYLEMDCSRYDFFYTIKASSPIIGGPSAGGAIAVLTAGVLSGEEVDNAVAMTGTINSGGIIGPVGGLQAKIEAAAELGLKSVLIPKGERFIKKDNLTLDLADYGKGLNLAVVEVGDLNEALFHFTGKRFKGEVSELEISQSYEDTMKYLAEMLCNRTIGLQQKFSITDFDKDVIDETFVEIENKAINYSAKGEAAFDEKQYYTSASYCFGANVRYSQLLIELTGDMDFDSVEKEINDFEERVNDVSIQTITDLQTYMVVMERLKDARDALENGKQDFEDGENYAYELGYAKERISSAESWNMFFNVEGKEFNLDKESLKQSCIKKLSEADERYQYAMIYFPQTLGGTKAELDHAYADNENGDYELCLFKASKAKAEADVILGVIGVAEDQVGVVLENKLEAVKRVISEQQKKDVFPILGYSYYEYAKQLKVDDELSALLYAEYALELSNLDIYFKNKKFNFINSIDLEPLILFGGGVLLGVIAVLLIIDRTRKKKR